MSAYDLEPEVEYRLRLRSWGDDAGDMTGMDHNLPPSFLTEADALTWLRLAVAHDLEMLAAKLLDYRRAICGAVLYEIRTSARPLTISFPPGGVLDRNTIRGPWSPAVGDIHVD